MRDWKKFCFEETGIVKRPLRVAVFVLMFIILLAGSWFLYYHSPEKQVWLICIVYKLSGYYCPGCGSGRACYSILHGRFYDAFCYNPLLCILLPWFALYIGICSVQWLLAGKETISRRIPTEITYVILAVVILYGILRNVDIYPFTLLAPRSVP